MRCSCSRRSKFRTRLFPAAVSRHVAMIGKLPGRRDDVKCIWDVQASSNRAATSGPEAVVTPLHGAQMGAHEASAIDLRLRALFLADQRYVRRREQRRRLQTALGLTSTLPAILILGQVRAPNAVIVTVLAAWALLFVLAHVLLFSEWMAYRSIRETADVVAGRGTAKR